MFIADNGRRSSGPGSIQGRPPVLLAGFWLEAPVPIKCNAWHRQAINYCCPMNIKWTQQFPPSFSSFFCSFIPFLSSFLPSSLSLSISSLSSFLQSFLPSFLPPSLPSTLLPSLLLFLCSFVPPSRPSFLLSLLLSLTFLYMCRGKIGAKHTWNTFTPQYTPCTIFIYSFI